MNCKPVGRMERAPWRAGVGIAVLALLLTGCSLRKVVEQSERVASAGAVAGTATVTSNQLSQADVVVALLRRNEAGQLSLYRMLAPSADGSFSMGAVPGEYYVGAFIDVNRDGHFQPGEPGQFYGRPTLVTVRDQETTTVALSVSQASRPTGLDLPADRQAPLPELAANIGVVAKIDDPRFDPDNGVLGMWRPIDFMDGPQGGLFMLSDYDPKRVPVLFVHGIAGTPRDFQKTIAGLDKKRYQPWVVYYPSGVRLEMISNTLASAMHQMQRRYGFTQYAVVAHSMGGLVARSYIQKMWDRYPDESKGLRMFITVNSPLGGMSSAAMAVENSPVVVPSWEDVATDSPFLRNLRKADWHSDVPYYLVFSYDGDKNGDGTVPLASQLTPSFQAKANRLFGFEGTHVGTLSDPEFITLMNQLLDASLTAPTTPKVAGH